MIKWHEVTWYSRLGAIILFIGVVPVLTFYIGTQYQAAVDLNAEQTVQAAQTNIAVRPVVSTTGSATSTVHWILATAGTDSQDPTEPRTKVSLTLGGVTFDAGTYGGSCTEITNGGLDSTGLYKGEISGVQCWWAGGGDEVGVFEDQGKLTLQHGYIDEGDSQAAGTRGDFKVLKVLTTTH